MQNTWYLSGPSFDHLPVGCEPCEGHQLGDLDAEPLAVFFAAGAATALDEMLAGQTEGMAAGILLGYVAHSHRPFLLITGVVAAATGKAVPNFTFNQQVWQQLSIIKKEQYPDSLVLGWFISQPGIESVGENACQQQSHWFPHPWQVLLIIDHKQNTSRFYRWENNTPVPLDNFAVWNEWKEPPASLLANTAPIEEIASEAEDLTPIATPWWSYAAWAALILLLLLAFFWSGSPVSIPHLRSLASQRQTELELLQKDLAVIDQTDISELIEEQSAENASTNNVSTNNVDISNEYIIKPGDTLWAISMLMLGSPHEYHRLATANGITNPSLIFPGNRITLPDAEHQ